MQINKSNYEIFFIDYLDGKLSDIQVDEFLDFLKLHPELKEELKSLSDFKLPVDEISFSGKEKLMKAEESASNSFDYRAAAFIEGDLSINDEKAFVEELDTDPSKEKEFDLMMSTKLQKETVAYPFKDELYQKSKIRLLYWSSRVAAIIVLLILIGGVFQMTNIPNNEPILAESNYPALQTDTDLDSPKQDPTKKKKSIEEINSTKTDSIPKKTKSIRERTKGRLKEIAILPVQERLATPDQINPIFASLPVELNPSVYAMHEMNRTIDSSSKYISFDKYLAQKLLKKERNKSINFEKLAQAGLKAFSGLSKEKINYQINAEGEVSEISLNTGLLAFSIPVTKK